MGSTVVFLVSFMTPTRPQNWATKPANSGTFISPCAVLLVYAMLPPKPQYSFTLFSRMPRVGNTLASRLSKISEYRSSDANLGPL